MIGTRSLGNGDTNYLKHGRVLSGIKRSPSGLALYTIYIPICCDLSNTCTYAHTVHMYSVYTCTCTCHSGYVGTHVMLIPGAGVGAGISAVPEAVS